MNINRPNPFNPNKNKISEDWNLWKKEFEIYMKLSGAYEKYSTEERALLLINLMGTEGVRAMEKITDEDDKKNMENLITRFDELFDPPLNEVQERYQFFSRKLGKNENIENYISDLEKRALTCNFGSQTEKIIIDQVICSMDSYLRNVIFAIENISLTDIVQYYNQFNINNTKIKELTYKNLNISNSKNQENKFCWKCNSKHIQGSCPAFGKLCNVCHQRNHFNNACKRQSKDIEQNCKKCESHHPFKPCPANKGNSEEDGKPRRICSKCGTNHPYMQCPAYNKDANNHNSKEDGQPRRICSKCGTNHRYMQCPAYNTHCQNCSERGHYTSQCKQQKSNDSVNQNNETTSTKHSNVPKPVEIKLNDCLWCESKHPQGQCPHAAGCTMCNSFPHNICFHCKKNPHDVDCQYSRILILPSKNPSNNNSRLQTSSKHKLNVPNSINHPSSQNNYCQAQSVASDPLLTDYVKVENVTKKNYQRPISSTSTDYQRPMSSTSTNYQRPISSTSTNYQRPMSSTSTNYQRPTSSTSIPNRNNLYNSKPNFRKENQKTKDDTCSIS